MREVAALLIQHGHCDTRTIEPGQPVPAQFGQRLDAVLIQLGLVSERGFAESYAALLDYRILPPDDCERVQI